MFNQTHSVNPIAYVRSPYQQKFAIPRQPGLVTAAKGRIEFVEKFQHPDFCRGLSDYSHLWLVFLFHQSIEQGYKSLVRPPRFGGKNKYGLFATRTTFRPNGIGLSVVKLDQVDVKQGVVSLAISGLDLLNDTPILDIKPYLPYSDAILDASGGFASEKPVTDLTVRFSVDAENQLQAIEAEYSEFRLFISQILNQDPRPAYKKDKPDQKIYTMRLYEFDIKWQIDLDVCQVLSIKRF